MLAFKALEPNAVLDVIAPAPLPTVKPDRVASVVEVMAVNAPVLAVEAPTVVPFTEPPVRATALASCVAIVPKPKFVRASVALKALVPPLATGSVAEIAGVIVVPSTYMERSAG